MRNGVRVVKILIQNGCVIDAKGDEGVELEVYDLDTQDCDLADRVRADWDNDTKDLPELEIF